MKYLFFGSHLDDIELLAGATIHKLIGQGHDIHYVGFSPCHNPIRLEIECGNATKTLGIPRRNVKIYGIPVRYFNEHRQDIANIVFGAIEGVRPDYVFTHHVRDKHPDHRAVAEETLRVTKCSILSYITPWNAVDAKENTFFEVSDTDVDKKIEALDCYVSQSERQYMNAEFVRSWAVTTGVRVGLPLAEGFEVVRLINADAFGAATART